LKKWRHFFLKNEHPAPKGMTKRVGSTNRSAEQERTYHSWITKEVTHFIEHIVSSLDYKPKIQLGLLFLATTQ
jgi:hypothetical protein